MNHRFWRKSLRLLAAASVVALAGFASGAQAQDNRPNVVVGVNNLALGLDPVLASGNVTIRITYSIYDTLIRRDFLSDGKGMGSKLVPGLATSWKRVDDRTLDLTLRQGVKFHNGAEMTSEDILFTFDPDRLIGPKSLLPEGRTYFGHLARVEALDKYTVRFIAKEPDPVLEQRLATYGSFIISKKAWLDAVKGDTSDPKWMATALKVTDRAPVGTGPLKFVEWKEGDYQRFTANDDYYGGKPAFKTLTFRQVPELASRVAGLVSGEMDLIVNIPPDQVQVFDRYKNIETKSLALANTQLLTFNTNHPLLKDKRVRQALSLAIDRPALITALWQNQAYVPNGHQMEDFGAMYNPQRPPPAHDPERAKQLLKEAGYNGEEIVLRTMTAYYSNMLSATQIIQQMWKKAGINMRLAIVENFTQTRTPDVMIYPWSNSYRLPDPVGGLVSLWGYDSALQKSNKYWTSPKAFNDAQDVVVTSMDPKARYAAFQTMLDIFEDEAPAALLYNPYETYAMKNTIQWTPYPLYFMDFRPDVFKIKTAPRS